MQRWQHSILVIAIGLALCSFSAIVRADDDGEGTYRVNGRATAALQRAGATIEGVGRGFVEITADSATVARLRAQGFQVVPVVAQPRAIDPAFHTYAQMVAEVQAVADAHPQIVSRFSIGKSYENRDLIAVKISDNVAVDEAEPEVLLIGHYHAREHLTVEEMLDVLHMLADGYGTPSHAAIDALVDSREIWLIFDLNPDGGEYDTSANTYHNWRKNRQPNACSTLDNGGGDGIGTDLNRNHSYRWGSDSLGSSPFECSLLYRGPAAASSPEVTALEQFVNSRVISGTQQINVAISFHTYGELILWPYGYTNAAVPPDMRPEDAAALAALGRAMAATNGYTPQQSSALYLTNGDFLDWAYGVHNIFAYTFEMSGYSNGISYGFYPPGSAIAGETARNREAVLVLLRNAACPYQLAGSQAQYCRGGRFQPLYTTWLPIAGR